MDAEKGAIRGGVAERTDEGGLERETVAAQRAGGERASRKGAAFLSNVIETTIKYERTTMNASNNPELFASSISRPENEGALRRALSLEGREDMIKLYDGGTSCFATSAKFMFSYDQPSSGQTDRLTRELTYERF